MEQEWHEERWAKARGRCGHCGLPRSVCSDPEKVLYPQRQVCYATMEREAANARYERLHKDHPWHDGTFTRWAEKPSAGFPYHFRFGVTIGVAETDLRPDDKFLTDPAAPFETPDPGEEVDGGRPS